MADQTTESNSSDATGHLFAEGAEAAAAQLGAAVQQDLAEGGPAGSAQDSAAESEADAQLVADLTGLRGVDLTESEPVADDGHLVPADVRGYQLDTIAIPEVLHDTWNQAGVDSVVAGLRKAGVPKRAVRDAVSAMATVQAERMSEVVRGVENARADASAALRMEWGDGYDGRLLAARQNFSAYAAGIGVDPGALAAERLGDGGLLGDNPALTAIFASLPAPGAAANTAAPGAPAAAAPAGFDPASALDELETIEANPALYDANAPTQGVLVRRRDALLAQLYPGHQSIGV